MNNRDFKESIVKLRSLREKLCKDHDNWQEAYEVRDFVFEQIQELHEMIVNRKIRRQKLQDKSSFILHSLELSPNDDKEGS